jgi:signal transduction histidine kinase
MAGKRKSGKVAGPGDVVKSDFEKATPDLHFDVSTGLKRVLGRELITNDEVAIFEMVKNSFDAKARTVYLHVDEDSITIADDGIGMTFEDLQNKWLFVAYSAKREGNEGEFRDKAADRKQYAGNKGIGRFSSDRLGERLLLQTRSADSKSKVVDTLSVDWERFEHNDTEHFESVPVEHATSNAFALPSELEKYRTKLRHGTVIRITKLRQQWKRDDLLSLKASLSKMINPFGSEIDHFSIIISAPAEQQEDRRLTEIAERKGEAPFSKDLVNGRVGNFIFSELQKKTTFIHVDVRGDEIHSVLTDRGELIYEILEPNVYPLLKDSDFSCEIYYLNQSAKVTFTRRVGLPSVQFGSLFLFRNGFRVYPIGNDGDDWFGFDRRKAQGYNRYLGSREIIGRVDVAGSGEDFQEASSRDAGLIDTAPARELRKAVLEHGLKRLEKYVVPVSWNDKLDAQTDDLSRLRTDPGRARVSAAVASLVDNDNITLLRYNKDLIGLINERSSDFEASLISLRSIASKTRDRQFLSKVDAAERRFAELKQSEAEANRIADEERAAHAAAEERARAAEEEKENEKRRANFLETVLSVDTATILTLHHQVTIYAVDINQQIDNLLAQSVRSSTLSRESLLKGLEQIAFLNRKVLAITRFASKATFKLDSETITSDLSGFIVEYVRNIVRNTAGGRLKVHIENEHAGLLMRFNPIDVSIIIDNLVSNARRARASQVTFRLSGNTSSGLTMLVTDNGSGLSNGADPTRVFEMGYSTTDGSGLGLYHVRQVLGEMGGSIAIQTEQNNRGLSLVIKFPPQRTT